MSETSQSDLTPPEAIHELVPPVYFAGGLGYDANRNSGVLSYIASQGHDVISPLPNPDFKAADTGFRMTINGVDREVSRRQAVLLVPKPEVKVSSAHFQQDRADQLVQMLAGEGTPKVRAIFQSADALNGLLAASQHSDMFSSITLAYPAGIIRQPNPVKAVPRTVMGAIKGRRPRHHIIQEAADFENADVRAQAKNFGGFVVAASVALSQQASLLHEMRKRDDAPGVSLVLGIHDAMISPSRVLASLESAQDVDYILITDTPHGVNGRDYVMKQMLDLFPRMEELRQGHQKGDPMKPLAERIIFPKNISPFREMWIENQARAVDNRSRIV